MSDSSGALIMGIIMLFLLGVFLPLVLSPFSAPLNDYQGYLSPIINFVQDGITFNLPLILGGDLTLNIFGIFGNFQEFLLNQIQGYSVIPAIIG